MITSPDEVLSVFRECYRVRTFADTGRARDAGGRYDLRRGLGAWRDVRAEVADCLVFGTVIVRNGRELRDVELVELYVRVSYLIKARRARLYGDG